MKNNFINNESKDGNNVKLLIDERIRKKEKNTVLKKRRSYKEKIDLLETWNLKNSVDQ